MNTIKERLSKGVIKFKFKKLNGEIREAVGTTNLDKIPSEKHPTTNRTYSNDTIRYFDLIKNEWRSFKILNFISEI